MVKNKYIQSLHLTNGDPSILCKNHANYMKYTQPKHLDELHFMYYTYSKSQIRRDEMNNLQMTDNKVVKPFYVDHRDFEIHTGAFNFMTERYESVNYNREYKVGGKTEEGLLIVSLNNGRDLEVDHDLELLIHEWICSCIGSEKRSKCMRSITSYLEEFYNTFI